MLMAHIELLYEEIVFLLLKLDLIQQGEGMRKHAMHTLKFLRNSITYYIDILPRLEVQH